jgi:DNA-binding CsgD family transcriptional regulator/TolA-binding protein
MAGLVGREPELAVIESFLADDKAGFAALELVGEAGIGKTTVWQAAVWRGGELGLPVLSARPAASEARLSFAGLTDLLVAVDGDVVGTLPAPQAEALDVALLRADASRSPGRRLVGTALLSVLRELTSRGPVLVAVDDAQWLDPPSASVLEFALRRLDDRPIRLVVSRRADASRPNFVGVHSRQLELGPLSVAALQRIVSERLGVTFSRPTLVRLAEASRGNAFFALEIARLLARGDMQLTAGRLPVPDDLRSLAADRIASLPTVTRDALLRAAALAHPDAVAVDIGALAPAEDAGLVSIGAGGVITFTHPLFASAVYESASAPARSDVHRALADVVDDPEQRTRHLALASTAPDEATARALESAARAARARGAPEAAAELVELALQLTPVGSPTLTSLRFELADHLYLAGDFQRAAQVLEELVETLPGGDLCARAALSLAEIEYWRGGESTAVRLTEQALRDAADPLLRARLLASIAMHGATSDLPRAADAARASLEILEAQPNADSALVATALAARVRADLFLGHGLDRQGAERALELEAAASPPVAVDARVPFKLGQWLRYVDDFAGARGNLELAERAALDEGDESSLANILLNRTLLECWSGNWSIAAALGDRTHELFQLTGISVGASNVWRAYVDAHYGRVDAVRAAALQADGVGEPIGRMLWERAVGLAELAAGDARAAAPHLAAAVEALAETGFREPAVWRLDGDAVEAALGAADLERAEALVVEFEASAARSQIPWSLAVSARCRALLLAAEGEPEQAAALLEQALVDHERCPMPFELARTLLAQGQVLRRGKKKLQARGALEQAATLFEQLGGAAWAARAREEVRRTAARSAPDELTPTELRIAHLAATGLTNDAIAAEVFVTRKTVEANLGRAYRKLGIRSRAQLARALDALSAS